jgi:GxxExxY protein
VAAIERRERKEYGEIEMKDIMELCDIVRQTAYEIHVFHAHGHLEKAYENALAHRLRKLGLDIKQQQPVTVYDEDGTVIGEYIVDLFVEDRLIVELKASRSIAEEHVAQILGYLRASRIEHGMLINFGSYEFQAKKYALRPAGQIPASTPAHLLSLPFFVLFALFRG